MGNRFIYAFVLLIFGFDFLSAAGNAKVLNFASNIGALVLFMVLGQVDYVIGLIMAISMIAGSYAGAHFAIKQGVGYVKVLFIIITAILILKMLLIIFNNLYKIKFAFD